MIYFTSDLHLCHDRDFLYEPRGFNSVYEMNEAIVNNWNEIITSDDDVYVLGDLMLNDNDTALKLIKQLNGNIHVVRGNHDTDSRIDLYNQCYNIVEVCEGKFFNYNGYHFFLSHYPCLCGNYDDEKPLKKKVISLCGHVHTPNKFLDMDKNIIYHCELDAHNNYPVSIEQIIDDIKNYIKEN